MSERQTSYRGLRALGAGATIFGAGLIATAMSPAEAAQMDPPRTLELASVDVSTPADNFQLLNRKPTTPALDNLITDRLGRLSKIAQNAIDRGAPECWVNLSLTVDTAPDTNRVLEGIIYKAYVSGYPEGTKRFRYETIQVRDPKTGEQKPQVLLRDLESQTGEAHIAGYPTYDSNCSNCLNSKLIIQEEADQASLDMYGPQSEVPIDFRCCTVVKAKLINHDHPIKRLPTATPTAEKPTPVPPAFTLTPTPVTPNKLPYGDASCGETKAKNLPLNPDGTCQGDIFKPDERSTSALNQQYIKSWQRNIIR